MNEDQNPKSKGPRGTLSLTIDTHSVLCVYISTHVLAPHCLHQRGPNCYSKCSRSTPKSIDTHNVLCVCASTQRLGPPRAGHTLSSSTSTKLLQQTLARHSKVYHCCLCVPSQRVSTQKSLDTRSVLGRNVEGKQTNKQVVNC